MRLIQDPAVGASSCAGLSKIKDALMFMVKCKNDPKKFMSDQWNSTINSLLDDVMSLRKLFRYTEIGHEGYHEFQSLLTKAMFFISRAFNGYHLYRDSNWNSAYLLVDSMEDLILAIEKIYHYTTSKVPTYIACLSVDLLTESINYLVRLARMNCSGLRLEDAVAFWRQIDFLEFISSHVYDHHITSELNTMEHLLVDTRAAIDTVINILSEFDPLQYIGLYSDKDLIDQAANIHISSDRKLHELGKKVAFISITTSAVIERGSRSSWIEEVVVQFWDCIIDSILRLLYEEASLMVPWKDQMEVLHDELSFLKYFLLDPPEEHTGTENTNKLLGKIKFMVCKQVTGLIYSFWDDMLEKEPIGGTGKTIELIKSLFKDAWQVPHFVRSNHRRNYDFRLFGAILKRLDILICSVSVSIPFFQNKKVLEELISFESYWNKIYGQSRVGILEVAHDMEYVIQSPEISSGPVWDQMLWFLDIGDRIKRIKEKIKKERHMSNYVSVSEEEVGFTEEEQYIFEQLIGESDHLKIISIVGIPGIGKTILAKKVYTNQTVGDHFSVRSWCHVSQNFQMRDLLIQILKHIMLFRENNSNMGVDQLSELLNTELREKRYFIVMDDLRDSGAWELVKRAFPNDCNGSRVLLTSRFRHPNLQPESPILPLKHLTMGERWELLQHKIYHSENCHTKLLTTGSKVFEYCGGLPLVVLLVGGLFKDMQEDQWEKVIGELQTFEHDPLGQYAALLNVSFEHLPYYLRPCFLYFGAFPRHIEISVERLIQLWIAEGFIQETGTECFESIAENYLIDLIQRNLVLVGQTTYSGHIKTCHVHPVIHDFCMKKDKEGSLQVGGKGKHESSLLSNESMKHHLGTHTHLVFPSSLSTKKLALKLFGSFGHTSGIWIKILCNTSA